MIERGLGSILDAQVEAIVNPANCVGAMGAGLSLAIRRRWPTVWRDFRLATAQGRIKTGSVCLSSTGQVLPHWVIHLPTKIDWRQDSRLEWIESGMTALVNRVIQLQLRSIAIPALGCGLGGLSWSDVEPVILRACERAPGVRWIIHGPLRLD